LITDKLLTCKFFEFRVKESKESCNVQYSRAFECLEKNVSKHDASGEDAGACTGFLEDFARCRGQ